VKRTIEQEPPKNNVTCPNRRDDEEKMTQGDEYGIEGRYVILSTRFQPTANYSHYFSPLAAPLPIRSMSFVVNFHTNSTPAFKVIVIGDVSVGKTSLISRSSEGVFRENHGSSLG